MVIHILVIQDIVLIKDSSRVRTIASFRYRQEFLLRKMDGLLDFENRVDQPSPQGPYYCSAGESAIGRDCVEKPFEDLKQALV